MNFFLSMSSGSHTKLLCKLFLLKSSPFARPPPVCLEFSCFVFPPQRGGRCCLVAGQTRSFTVRYRSASCRWRRTVSALNSWLLHTRFEVAYSSLYVETRGEADKIKTNEKAEMPDPLFSLSFHGLFLFPLTPCNSLSPVCPLLLLFYRGVVFRSSSHTGPPTLSGGGRGGEPT